MLTGSSSPPGIESLSTAGRMPHLYVYLFFNGLKAKDSNIGLFSFLKIHIQRYMRINYVSVASKKSELRDNNCK